MTDIGAGHSPVLANAQPPQKNKRQQLFDPRQIGLPNTMHPRLLRFTLFVASAAVVVSCSGEDPASDPRCVLGTTRTCEAADGCVGISHCYRDGWSECQCLTTDSQASSMAQPAPVLGAACSNDSNCPTSSFCLLPTGSAWLGGGPPKGLCVADCTDGVGRCTAFSNAVCVAASRSNGSEVNRALCMPACDPRGHNSSLTCSAVPSSGCEPLTDGSTGFCRPFCGSDGECTSGHCDRREGTCVAEAPPQRTVTFGQSCKPGESNCDGVCLELSSGSSVCTARCVIGGMNDSAASTAGDSSVCAYTTGDFVPGNIGYGALLCNCDDECVASGFVCEPFSSKDMQSQLMHVGMCWPRVDSVGTTHTGVSCAAGHS